MFSSDKSFLSIAKLTAYIFVLSRKYVPKLAKYPPEYIYEPWKAPLSTQKAAGCIIGQDYPKRVVDHDTIVKKNLQRMNAAYAKDKKPDDKKGTKRSMSEMEKSDDYSDEILPSGTSSNKKTSTSGGSKSKQTKLPFAKSNSKKK